MSETPRTDVREAPASHFNPRGLVVDAAHCRELELELVAANAKISELEALIERSDLEEVDGVKAEMRINPVYRPYGKILIHKEHIATIRQHTLDLQALANTARKLAAVEQQLNEVRKDGERIAALSTKWETDADGLVGQSLGDLCYATSATLRDCARELRASLEAQLFPSTLNHQPSTRS